MRSEMDDVAVFHRRTNRRFGGDCPSEGFACSQGACDLLHFLIRKTQTFEAEARRSTKSGTRLSIYRGIGGSDTECPLRGAFFCGLPGEGSQ